MPKKITWTEAQDMQIKRLRAEGRTWDDVCQTIGQTRWAVIDRGRRIGARLPPPDFIAAPPDPHREALPAGHPVTWSAITEQTVLAGVAYRRIPPR